VSKVRVRERMVDISKGDKCMHALESSLLLSIRKSSIFFKQRFSEINGLTKKELS